MAAPPSAWDAAGVVLSLIDKGLVASQPGGRLALLRCIREYAALRLAERTDAYAESLRRHARWCASEAQRDPLATGPGRPASARDLARALDFSLMSDEPGLIGPLADGLLAAHYDSGGSPGLVTEVQDQIAGTPLAPRWELRLLRWACLSSLGACDWSAAEADGEDGLRTAQTLGDRAMERQFLGLLGITALRRGDRTTARDRLESQVRAAERLSDPRHLGRSLLALAEVATSPRPLLLQAIDLLHAAQDSDFLGKALANLGELERRSEHLAVALGLLQRSVDLAVQTGNLRSEGMRRLGLARALADAGNEGGAQEELSRARRCSLGVGDRFTLERVEAFARATGFGGIGPG